MVCSDLSVLLQCFAVLIKCMLMAYAGKIFLLAGKARGNTTYKIKFGIKSGLSGKIH